MQFEGLDVATIDSEKVTFEKGWPRLKFFAF